MTRRRLGLDEIAHYRESYGDQLRTALLAGKPTATIRKAIVELDEQERDAHAAIAAEAAAVVQARTDRGRALVDAIASDLARMLADLEAPVMHA